MSPVRDNTLAYSLLFAASDEDGMPKSDEMRDILERVHIGISTLWLEGRNTLMVTSFPNMTTLYIDLIYSRSAGAVSRNWEGLMKLAKDFGIDFIRCKPLGSAQARLYRMHGFTADVGEYMQFDCREKS